MQTSSSVSVAIITGAARSLSVAAAVLAIGCGGSEFQSTDTRSGVTADGGDALDGGANGGRANTGAGGRGSSGSANGGAASTGGNRNAGGGSGALGSGGLTGAGGTTGRSGAPDEPDASSASGGSSGAGGTTGLGGQQNSGGAVACTAPTTFYPDSDQDSFGRSTGTITACAAPSNGNWSATGGDCDDDAKLVFPKEPTYYDASYTTVAGKNSFDYDCSGVEEGASGQLGTAPACSSLSLLGCTGIGFVPTTRSGPGVNPLCGSTSKVTCTANGIGCAPMVTMVAPYRCK